ncbi:MAG: ABC transporter substrate-binding protein, partial [Thermoplasmata archaeon]|nr:ABC transporter substrate-binding protein [Thermoplasmata archaeon]
DANGMQYDLERGILDVAQFPPDNYKAIKDQIEDGNINNMTAYDGLKCTQYWTEIGINMNPGGPNPSRLDPYIRWAMAMSTNKTYIVQNFYKGFADEGTTLISPVNEKWHYEPTEDELFPFDLDAASQMLEDAGYVYTDDSPTVRVCSADSWAVQEGLVPVETPLQYDMLIRQEFPEEKEIAKFLAAQWANIGIDIEISVVTEVTLSTIVYTYTYDTMIWYWSADPDPNFMLFCQSKNSWNGWSDNQYSNESYEENYSRSVSEFDYDLRKEYCDNVQRISYQDAAYILLAYPYQTYIWRTDTFEGWGDWEANPGRSIDAFWTGNPLWFDLKPIGDGGGDVDIMMIAIGGGVAVAAVVAVVLGLKFLKKKGGKKEDSEESGGSPLGD